MSNESIENKLLEKILASNEFSHSKIYQTYLTYLVEASREGKDLKETVIAIEVFGKDATFNPAEDTIVRSHTYTLRKKLESYYFHEGREDKLRLKIPKGHYNTKFVTISDNIYHPKRILNFVSRRLAIPIMLTLILITIIMLIINYSLKNQLHSFQCIESNDPIWKEYLNSSLPILVVVGDHFFFTDYLEKYHQEVGIRHPAINSMEDFQQAYPNYRVIPSAEPYFPYHSIWSLPPILSILYSVHETPILRKSSDVSPQMLDEYNIIFLGSIKTLYKLKHTLLKSHFDFEVSPHRVFYKPDDKTETQIFETSLHSTGPNEDLILALKLPGPDNNSIFIIASYHSLGAPEIANYLILPETRKDLEQRMIDKFHRVPKYFEILFRVTGIDKTAYNTEILVFNQIKPDQQ
jgi:hypothetical protein